MRFCHLTALPSQGTTPFLASPQLGLESARPQQLQLDSHVEDPHFQGSQSLSDYYGYHLPSKPGSCLFFPLAIPSPTITRPNSKQPKRPNLPTLNLLLPIPFCPLINHPCGLVFGRPRRLTPQLQLEPIPSHHIINFRPAPFPPPGAEQPFFSHSHSRRVCLVSPSSFPSSSSKQSSINKQQQYLYVLPPLTPSSGHGPLIRSPFQSAPGEPRRLLPREAEATPPSKARQRAAHPRWRHRQQGPRWAISCSSSVSAGPSCPQQTIPICHEMSCGFRLWG